MASDLHRSNAVSGSNDQQILEVIDPVFCPASLPGKKKNENTMRLMLVQFAGDYLEAHQRLQDSGDETYYGHRYVLEQLASLGNTFGEAAVLCCSSPRQYDTTLPSGVRVMATSAHSIRESRAVIGLMRDYDPTHVVFHSPLNDLIRWSVTTNRKVACVLADSFNDRGLKRLLKYGRLARLLNDPRIDMIANHGVNACLSLVDIGVTRQKIIPWDWPHIRQPRDTPPKTGPGAGVQTLVFVGAVSERKGVGDVIAAVAELKRRGLSVVLSLADASFSHVFSWGVVIHIPDTAHAIDNLCRIVAPGGKLALQITNMNSLDFRIQLLGRRVLSKPLTGLAETAFGVGRWYDLNDDRIWVLRFDAAKLTRAMAERGFRLISRRAAEFTEFQTHMRGALRSALLMGNRLAYAARAPASLSCTQIMVFEKAA